MGNVPTGIITTADTPPSDTVAPYNNIGYDALQGGYWTTENYFGVNFTINSEGITITQWRIPIIDVTETFTGQISSLYENIGAITLYLVPGNNFSVGGTNTLTFYYFDGSTPVLMPLQTTNMTKGEYQIATTGSTGELNITVQPNAKDLLVLVITLTRPGRIRVSQPVSSLGGVIQGISFNPCCCVVNDEDYSVCAPSSAITRALLSTTYGYSAWESWSFDATEASPYPYLRLTLQPCGSWPNPAAAQVTKLSNPLEPPYNAPEALLWVGRGYEPGYAYFLAATTQLELGTPNTKLLANCIGQFADTSKVLVVGGKIETTDAVGTYMHSGAITSLGIVILTPSNLVFYPVDVDWYPTGVGNAGYTTAKSVTWNPTITPTYTYAGSYISPSSATVLIGGVTTLSSTAVILAYTIAPSSSWSAQHSVTLTGVDSPTSPQSWAIVSTKNDIWLIATKQNNGLVSPASFYAYTIPGSSGTSLTKIGDSASSVLRSVLGPVVALPLADVVLWLDGDFGTSGAGLVVFSNASNPSTITKRSYVLTWTGVATTFTTYPVFVEQVSTTSASFITGDADGNVYMFMIETDQAEGVTEIELNLTIATGMPPPAANDCVRLTTFTGFDDEPWVCRTSSYLAGDVQESFTRYGLAFP